MDRDQERETETHPAKLFCFLAHSSLKQEVARLPAVEGGALCAVLNAANGGSSRSSERLRRQKAGGKTGEVEGVTRER
ncbi:hypothetical protein DPEC_G00108360 [Dallia pectoralis]|uniref:Uncharacterized protein n=1 Tax=Dallia pectoralis TaxID=75939 RepID=A0ACC2GSV4_DALPE|nr:hypothetical protein DPEC_G00108360 [Dallia pectoralis]